MKVGILTFPNSPSFGASLQMYALYNALKAMEMDVEIINYKNIYMRQGKHIKESETNIIKKVLSYLLCYPSTYRFRKFEKQLLLYPRKTMNEKDNLQKISSRYDCLICGSDQVWNPFVTDKDLNYFFAFAESGCKKISYAASFGVNEIEKNYAQKIKAQLSTFDGISIREEQGQKIIEDMLGIKCDIVLDPSMLIEMSEWKKVEKKVCGLPEHYIARFIFNYDADVEKRIIELSKETGLPIVTIGGTLLSKFSKNKYTGPIGPQDWLYVIDHADYVVTDSFHGAAFSIIFEKELYVSLASVTNSRLKTLMRTFSIEHRIISGALSSQRIDYVTVKSIMADKREDSLKFLKSSMGIG